jgi:hypothetical protein
LAIFQHFGLFSSFFPSSVDLAPDVGFGKTWYLWKACDVYLPMEQILCHSEFQLRNCRLQNRDCRRSFLVGGPFSGVDSGQLEYAFDEPKEPFFR